MKSFQNKWIYDKRPSSWSTFENYRLYENIKQIKQLGRKNLNAQNIRNCNKHSRKLKKTRWTWYKESFTENIAHLMEDVIEQNYSSNSDSNDANSRVFENVDSCSFFLIF